MRRCNDFAESGSVHDDNLRQAAAIVRQHQSDRTLPDRHDDPLLHLRRIVWY